MTICSTCGKSTPEGRFCEHCGAQLVAPAPVIPPQPAGSAPPDFFRSFYYSGIFYVVLLLDALASLFMLGLGIYGFSIEAYRTVLDATGFSLAVYLIVIGFANLALDASFFRHRAADPHSIDSRTCWTKVATGFLGILTILSGLYFLIISTRMQAAYDATRR